MIGAVGIVYGDIGTSPLYTLKECFLHGHLPVEPQAILGVVSLIFWLLVTVVSVKYVTLILQADHKGEGGILALTTLVLRSVPHKRQKSLVVWLGLVGTALFYGDGVITPAISVLAALEGISVATPSFAHFIMPLSVFLLGALFLLQKHGTDRIGGWFGPIMIFWFVLIGVLGLLQILKNPAILAALNPWHALRFFITYSHLAAIILGFVVLAVTGVEALYADIGHFNKRSIRLSWFCLIWPALTLNYFGQGALLLENSQAVSNPFYFLVPSWGVYPMVFLATTTTIIASQSVISGIFSISWQAVQLGYLPRMRVIHTSRLKIGQVYVPLMNYSLLILTIGAVLLFQSSDRLAAAYGLSITGIMMITTLLTLILARYHWQWSLLKIISVFSGLILLDFSLLGSNFIKLLEGGWFSVLIAWAAYLVITTWQQGRKVLMPVPRFTESLPFFVQKIRHASPPRVPGVAVFLGNDPEKIPTSFQIAYKHTPILHQTVFFLCVVTKDVPKVHTADRLKIIPLGDNIYQMIVFYGFSEVPNIQTLFEKVLNQHLSLNVEEITFFVTRGRPVVTNSPRLKGWREWLFIFLTRNTTSATDYFKLPYHRVVELGIRFRV